MSLRFVTWNVLADAWLHHGNYHHAPASLLKPRARYPHIVRVLRELQPHVVGLQEVELELTHLLADLEGYALIWSKKTDNDPDGCAVMVKVELGVPDVTTVPYDTSNGYIMQTMEVAGITCVNTRIKWGPAGQARPPGSSPSQAVACEAWQYLTGGHHG